MTPRCAPSTRARQQVPAGTELTTGYRILLVPGTYPVDGSVNYWEDRRGTADAPIVLEAADGPHTATFEADMNVFGVSHLDVLGVDIIREKVMRSTASSAITSCCVMWS